MPRDHDNGRNIDNKSIPYELIYPLDSEKASSVKELDLPKSMSGDGPLVSIIIPTYKDAEYLTEALYTLGNQTHKNIEVILVDSSNDQELEYLAINHDWIRYFSTPANGVSAARNDGIKKSSGEIIALLDADDYWHKNKIEKQVSVLESDENMVYSDYIDINIRRSKNSVSYMDGSPYQSEDMLYLARFFNQIPIQTSTLAFKKSIISGSPFNESIIYGEDTLFMFEYFKKYPPVHISEPLSVRRKRSGSLQSSINDSYQNTSELLRYYIANYPELKPAFEAWFGKRDAHLGKRHIRSGNRYIGRKHLERSIELNGKKISVLLYYIISLFPIEKLRSILKRP
jgi:glycosyltransferase involved in cell wall biosynthesis